LNVRTTPNGERRNDMSNVFCQRVTAQGPAGEDALKTLADTIANHLDVKGVPDDFFTFGKTEDGLATLAFTAKHPQFTGKIVREVSPQFPALVFKFSAFPSLPDEGPDYFLWSIAAGVVTLMKFDDEFDAKQDAEPELNTEMNTHTDAR
jgi:hypothetical protein